MVTDKDIIILIANFGGSLTERNRRIPQLGSFYALPLAVSSTNIISLYIKIQPLFLTTTVQYIIVGTSKHFVVIGFYTLTVLTTK